MNTRNLKINLFLATSLALSACSQVSNGLGQQQTDPLAKAEKVAWFKKPQS